MALAGSQRRIMRVKRVEGATWEEAMPPLAPSNRSPTATPELSCSTIYPEVPLTTLKSSLLGLCPYMNVVPVSSKSQAYVSTIFHVSA